MQLDDIASSIGQQVRRARNQAGLSRKALATAANVSERYLNQLEKGAANVSIGILLRVASALSLDFAVLLGGDGAAPVAAPGSLPREVPAPLAALIAGMTPREQAAAHAHLARFLQDQRRAGKGIALLGLRGAGKTTLGRLLADRHGWPFVSITREIETRAGMSLADLFNLGGADAYRALENEVIADLVGGDRPSVVETAGGIAGNPEALAAILAAFRTVWLQAAPEEHLARVARQGDTRPMHGNPKALDQLKALLSQRTPDYARADHTLDTTGRSPDDCLAELERIAAPVLANRRA